MGYVIRGENFKVTYAVESAYGTDPGTASLVNSFGVVQTANITDPQIDYMPFWGMSTGQYRNWWITYKGKISLGMSIPDIVLLNGAPLFLPLGSCTTTGTNPYTHTMAETYDLPTITTHVTYTDTNDADVLMRRFCGGKVGRATYSATEGGFLTMALEDIQFKNLYHNKSGHTWYSANVADVTPSYPCTEPYLFSYGSLTLDGSEFARVKEWRLSVDNALEPKYYVTNDAISQLPYEHREGRRQYQMSVTCDIEDAALYQELIDQGTYSSVYKGFVATMVFTRGSNDTITFTTPSSGSVACGGGNMGCLIKTAPHSIVSDPIVPVSLDIICRSLSIVSVDAVSTYSGSV
jgi:hypothetical protein